jgi:hypothetical protein
MARFLALKEEAWRRDGLPFQIWWDPSLNPFVPSHLDYLSFAALGPTSRAPYFLMVSYEPVVDIVRAISSAQQFFRPWRAASGAVSVACAPAQVESRLGACRAQRA